MSDKPQKSERTIYPIVAMIQTDYGVLVATTHHVYLKKKEMLCFEPIKFQNPIEEKFWPLV